MLVFSASIVAIDMSRGVPVRPCAITHQTVLFASVGGPPAIHVLACSLSTQQVPHMSHSPAIPNNPKERALWAEAENALPEVRGVVCASR